MKTDLFKELTKKQMVAALNTLRQGVEGSSDEIWYAGHIDAAVNRVVFHTLFFTDLYLNSGTGGFREQPFHVDRRDFFKDYEEMENRSPVNSYSRSGCREYLLFCIDKAREVIDGETDEVLAAESGFSWQKRTRAELHIYNTRHIQHHAAQLGLRNQLLGGEPFDWIGG